MTSLYAYSLIPVLSVALLLFTSALLYARSMPGLTLYCAAIAIWSASLLMFAFPELTGIAKHFAQTGAFVSAAFIHAAYDFTHQRQYTLVWLAYYCPWCRRTSHRDWPMQPESPPAEEWRVLTSRGNNMLA